jgi:hypothetical protein
MLDKTDQAILGISIIIAFLGLVIPEIWGYIIALVVIICIGKLLFPYFYAIFRLFNFAWILPILGVILVSIFIVNIISQ